MDYEELNYRTMSGGRQMEAAATFPVLMRKTYMWMAMALVITGLTAYEVATNAAITQFLLMNHQIMWVLLLAELGLVIGLTAAIRKISLPVATLMFVAYAVLNGVTLSSLFYVYTMGSLASVFLITAGTFGAMSLVGFFTKSDLSSMSRILFMALIGLVIASVVNMFANIQGLERLLSYVGVLIFVGLTAYDTQKIKQMYLMAPDASEATQKYAVLGALTLYLDFINLFLYLLRIFGRRE